MGQRQQADESQKIDKVKVLASLTSRKAARRIWSKCMAPKISRMSLPPTDSTAWVGAAPCIASQEFVSEEGVQGGTGDGRW